MASLKRVDVRVVVGRDPFAAASGSARTRNSPRRGRPLAIEDYYRIQTVGSPEISPDGRWVVFSRVDADRGGQQHAHRDAIVVPSRRVCQRRARVAALRQGRRPSPSWTDRQPPRSTRPIGSSWTVDPAERCPPSPVKAAALPAGAVVSADRKWIALAKDKPQPKTERDVRERLREAARGALQGRHVRLEGFPARRRSRFRRRTCARGRRRRSCCSRRPAATAKMLVDTRPAARRTSPGIPTAQLLAFTADPDWRDELKYEQPDLWTVTTDGKVTRLTDDGYVYGDVDFSPDGKYLSYARSVRHRHDHPAEAESWRAARSLRPPASPAASRSTSPRTGISSRATRAGRPTAGSSTSRAGIGGETHLFRVVGRRRRGRAGDQRASAASAA